MIAIWFTFVTLGQDTAPDVSAALYQRRARGGNRRLTFRLLDWWPGAGYTH
jgi:hypothetical protein